MSSRFKSIRFGTNKDEEIRGSGGNDIIFAKGGSDHVYGGFGHDIIFGGHGNDYLYGENGNDILFGGSGIDSIFGGSGADIIFGGSGNDNIRGGEGGDYLNGGSGIDTLNYAQSDDGVYVNLARNKAYGGHAQGDKIKGFENIVGSEHDDTLIGDRGDNHIIGGAGNDTIKAGRGDDFISASAGINTVYAGRGDDTIYASVASNVDGGSGNDIVRLFGSDDVITLADLDLSNIEEIELIFDQTLIVAGQAVRNSTGDEDFLIVRGSDRNTVEVNTDIWEHIGATDHEGESYNVYESEGQTLWVETDVNAPLDANNAPVAVLDEVETTENEGLVIDALANDTDVDGDALRIYSVTAPPNSGSFEVIDDQIHFDPGTDFDYLAAGESTEVIVDYEMSDGTENVTGQISLTIHGENDAPVAVADTVSVDANDVLFFDAFENDYDAEGDFFYPQYYGGYPAVGSGEADFSAYKFVFNPRTDFDHLGEGESRTVDVSYRVQDHSSGSSGNVSTISVTVNGTSAGENDDTFVYVGANMDYELVHADNLIETEMENVDLTGTGDNSIGVTVADILSFTDDNDTLKILGDAGDEVRSTGEGWVQGDDQTIEGEVYHTYTSGGATLLIDEDVTQNIT